MATHTDESAETIAEERLKLVKANIGKWIRLLDSIESSIAEWQLRLKEASQTVAQSSLWQRKRSDSLQSIVEDAQQSTSTHLAPPTRHESSNPSVFLFDSEIQKLMEDFAGHLQSTRTQLLGHTSKVYPTSGRGYLAPGDGTNGNVPLSPASSSDIFDTVTQMEKQIRLSQDECEDAAHQLLRSGECTSQLRNMRRHISRCAELSQPRRIRTAASGASSIRSGVSPSRSTSGPYGNVHPGSLVADENEEDSDGEEDKMKVRFEAIRATSKRLSSQKGRFG